MDQDLYAILEITRRATPDEIKDAYRRKVREHHPDANPAHREESEAIIKAVLSAYHTLSDPLRKERYDRDMYPGGLGEEDVNQSQADSAHKVYIHPSVTITVSVLGRVREGNRFSKEEMAKRLGLSEDQLAAMELRDAVPQSPIQLRTLTNLVEQAVRNLRSNGKAEAADLLETHFNRKKNHRAVFR